MSRKESSKFNYKSPAAQKAYRDGMHKLARYGATIAADTRRSGWNDKKHGSREGVCGPYDRYDVEWAELRASVDAWDKSIMELVIDPSKKERIQELLNVRDNLVHGERPTYSGDIYARRHGSLFVAIPAGCVQEEGARRGIAAAREDKIDTIESELKQYLADGFALIDKRDYAVASLVTLEQTAAFALNDEERVEADRTKLFKK